MYDRHPSVELNARFRGRPFQGVAPEEAGIVFVGLDANYAPEVESTPAFESIIEYHEDGVGFWRRHGVHHPFLLASYRGDGRLYHRNFARIGFTPADAHRVSFIELLHVPTVGANRDLEPSDFDSQHLARIDRLVTSGTARRVFLPSSVMRLMRATRRFAWLRSSSSDAGELPIWGQHGHTTVHGHLHFSNFGRFQRRLDLEARAIGHLCGVGATAPR